MLLHFNERQRCDVLRMFHGALRKDGLLVMEHTQKVPEALRPLLEQAAPHAQVYRKIEIPAANLRAAWTAARQTRVGLPTTKYVVPEQAPATPRLPPPSTSVRLTLPAGTPTEGRFRRADHECVVPVGRAPPNFLPQLNSRRMTDVHER